MNFKFIYYCIRVYALSLCYQEMAIDTEQDLILDIQKHKNLQKEFILPGNVRCLFTGRGLSILIIHSCMSCTDFPSRKYPDLDQICLKIVNT